MSLVSYLVSQSLQYFARTAVQF